MLTVLLAALALSDAAQAACRPPKDVQPAPAYAPPPAEIARTPTTFYILAIAWGPEWRRTQGKIPATAQRLDDPGARGFFLHGLWPNGEAPPYPRYCRTVGEIPRSTVRSMYCRTPSAELLQHEWQAHGACGWPDAPAYFAEAARLYDRLKRPRLRGEHLTAAAIRQAFAHANPALPPDAIIVAQRDGRFSEARVCYDMAFKPRTCPPGQGAKPQARLIISTPPRTP